MKNFYKLLLAEFANPVQLATLKYQKPFTIYSEDGKLFVRSSSNKDRLIDEKGTNIFYEEFKKIGSTSPQNYIELTRHSSYLIAALQYLKEK